MKIFLLKLRYRFRTQKKRKSSPRTARRRRILLRCFLLLFFLVLGTVGFAATERRLGSMAQDAALSELDGEIVKEMHRAVETVLSDPAFGEPLLLPQQNQEGEITSLSTNVMAVNRIKNQLAEDVQARLENHRIIKASIPAGALFSDSILSGFGFPIPVRAFAVHDAEIRLYDAFETAGINQTRYQLMVEMSVPMRIIGVFSHRDTTVTTQIPLAEMILVGPVPQTYWGSSAVSQSR